MDILVTGGCGFIGSNFIRYIFKNHPAYRIVNLDKLTYCGNPENLSDIEQNPNYTFIKGDICDPDIVEDLTENVDVIINFAAQTHVDRSIVDAREFLKTNILGTHILLEAARKFAINKFIQISTDEVYGSIEDGYFAEESPVKPNSPYAASKAAADHLVRSYNITYRLPVIIVRSSNNFGPYQFPEKVIPLFITNALDNKKLPLYADGSNVREWLYVEDNASAIDLILHKGKIGEIYNVGSGIERTNLELTHAILKLLDKPNNLIEFVKDRPGHDKRYALKWEKVKQLGWQPKYTFEEALKLTADWYIKNRSWWEKLKVCVSS